MDYSLENFEKKVTLFYSLATGEIKLMCGGIQDMSYFGSERADFNYDFVVVDKDEYLINNLEKFIIKNGELMMKAEPNLNKYKIAD
ncbi:hypothetical protein G6Z34_13040 [Clostridium perfringens]|uniref:Uncharacterized protein n=1 Tax=Clostridium perfringens TaxID=1502 RepID=A0AAP7BWA0_CLOPF|nr:hypothetical protein [Clostridium perfringens]